MSIKTMKAIACDARCGAQLDATGAFDAYSLAAAEAGWRMFQVSYHSRSFGPKYRRFVFVCPDCRPRDAAELYRASLVAEADAAAAAELAKYASSHGEAD